MKRAAWILPWLIVFPLFATDTTNELLTAPLIKEKMAFRINGDTMVVAVDGTNTFVDVVDGVAFVMKQQRDMTFREFNPFLYTISTTEKTEKDPNFGSIAGLLDAIQKMATPTQSIAAGEETPKTPDEIRNETNKRLRKALDKIREKSESIGLDADCTAYKALRIDLNDLHNAMTSPFIDANEVNGWVAAATTAQGVGDVQGKIDAVVGQLNDNVTLMKDLDLAIAKRYIPGKQGEDECGKVHASTFALVYEISRRLSTAISAHAKLAEDLGTLSTNLKPFANPNNWRPENKTEYIFYRPTPSMDDIKIATISIKPRKFSVGAGPSLKVVEETAVTRSVRFRHYTVIVPEMSAAVIKTDLKFPKYGTEEVGGVIKIKSAGTDDFPAAGAVVLNGVCRCWSSTFVYPELQFGVTNSKDYPGFIIGGGFRFTYPRPLSVVAGYIYTWTKDLVGKKVGDVVSGTADLEAALQRKSKRGSYIGIQYSF